jgi:hypothetical protein
MASIKVNEKEETTENDYTELPITAEDAEAHDDVR